MLIIVDIYIYILYLRILYKNNVYIYRLKYADNHQQGYLMELVKI